MSVESYNYEDDTKFFKNKEDLHLYYEHHSPEEKARGNVFLVHGFGEHSNAYQWKNSIIPTFLRLNVNVFIIDHQGHGKSQGFGQTDVKDFQNFIDDYLQFTHLMLEKLEKNDQGGLPNFLLGHSLGGVIGFEIVRQSQELWKGAVFNGSAYYVSPEIATPTVKFLAKVLSFVTPNLALADKLDESQLSSLEEVATANVNDPLRYHGGAKARFTSSFFARVDQMKETNKEFQTPVLFVHGCDDVICLKDGSQQLYDECGSDDKTIKFFEGMRHESLCEKSTDCIDFVSNWFDEKMKASDSTSTVTAQ